MTALKREIDRSLLFKGKELFHSEHVLTSREITVDRKLADFLAVSNLRLNSLAETQPLRLRVTAFSNLCFIHQRGPSLELDWHRNADSIGRAVIVVVFAGGLTIGSSYIGTGQYALIPPGETLVRASTQDCDNDILVISFGAHKLEGLQIGLSADENQELLWISEIDSHYLRPFLSFIISLCGLDFSPTDRIGTLQDTSRTIVRALVRVAVGAAPENRPIYERAVGILESEYANIHLNAPLVAARLGVSTRTMQTVFERRGETVSRNLRSIRARAAISTRAANPRMPPIVVAKLCGFGSESAMYRAIREYARPSLKTS